MNLSDTVIAIIMRAEWAEASAQVREKYLMGSYCDAVAAERSL
jgi:hypothetical protein